MREKPNQAVKEWEVPGGLQYVYPIVFYRRCIHIYIY